MSARVAKEFSVGNIIQWCMVSLKTLLSLLGVSEFLQVTLRQRSSFMLCLKV